MSNIIKHDFSHVNDRAGYLLNHDNNYAKVEGIYVDNICAMVEGDKVYLGTKADDGIDDALTTTMKEMNEFCLMWLLIFNESVIAK